MKKRFINNYLYCRDKWEKFFSSRDVFENKFAFIVSISFHIFLFIIFCWQSFWSNSSGGGAAAGQFGKSQLVSKMGGQSFDLSSSIKTQLITSSELNALTAKGKEIAPPDKQLHYENLQEQIKEEGKLLIKMKRRSLKTSKSKKIENKLIEKNFLKAIEAEKLDNNKKRLGAATRSKADLATAKKNSVSEINRKIIDSNSVKAGRNTGTTTTAGSSESAASNSEIDKYKRMIIDAISQEWSVPDNVNENDMCKLLLKIAPDGTVLDVVVTYSSGNDVLVNSAKTAIMKSSPIPVPQNSVSFEKFREISVTVHPMTLDF